MSKVEDVKNCWLMAIVTMLQIIGLIVGNLYFTSRVTSLESEIRALQKDLEESKELMKERINNLDHVLLEKIKNATLSMSTTKSSKSSGSMIYFDVEGES